MSAIDDKIAAKEREIEKLRLVKQLLDDPEQRSLIEQELAERRLTPQANSVVCGAVPEESHSDPVPEEAKPVPEQPKTALKKLEAIFATRSSPMTISEMAEATGVGAPAIRIMMRRNFTRFVEAGLRGKEALFSMSQGGSEA